MNALFSFLFAVLFFSAAIGLLVVAAVLFADDLREHRADERSQTRWEDV